MLNNAQKATFFKLLLQVVEHDVEIEKLFITLSQRGPAWLTAPCGRAAVNIKKQNSFPEAGLAENLFTSWEANALEIAIQKGRLVAALQAFHNHYLLKMRQCSIWQPLWKPISLLLICVWIASLPELMFDKMSATGYLCRTMLILLPILFIITAMVFPKWFFNTRWVHALNLSAAFIKLPHWGQLHIRHEIDNFLEAIGILHTCGYQPGNAVNNAIDQTNNATIKNSLSVISSRIQQKDTFLDAIAVSEFLPEEYLQRLSAAEKNNTITETLIEFKTNTVNSTAVYVSTAERTMLSIAGVLALYAVTAYIYLS